MSVYSFRDWKILLCGTIKPSDQHTWSIETSCPTHFQPFLWIRNKNDTPESPPAHTGSCLSTGGKVLPFRRTRVFVSGNVGRFYPELSRSPFFLPWCRRWPCPFHTAVSNTRGFLASEVILTAHGGEREKQGYSPKPMGRWQFSLVNSRPA